MLSIEIKQSIYEFIVQTLRNKFATYEKKDEVMPFHFRLLGKDRMALFSFIQSINTMFGTSIFEQVAVRLAKEKFAVAKNHVSTTNLISGSSQLVIENIIDNLRTSQKQPDKILETKRILDSVKTNDLRLIRTPLVDVWLESHQGELFLIDIKTVKPNIDNFISYKKTLLEWVAVELAKDSTRPVSSLIAMPYNPYEPKPYHSWQLRGMLDISKELLVGKDFWDFVGGEGAYEELLDCFERAGITLRPEIDHYFGSFEKT